MLITLMLTACSPDPDPPGSGTVPHDDTDTTDDTAGTDDTGQAQSDWEIVPLLSASVLQEADEGGRLTVDCAFALDGAFSDPGVEATVTIDPMDGVTVDGDAWTFESYGAYTVTCGATVDGVSLTATQDLRVVTEVLDPDVSALVAALDQTRAAHVAVALADGGADEDMVAAIDALTAAREASEGALSEGTTSVLRAMPDSYWPTPEQLEAEGIVRNEDDDALAAALTDWGDALRLLDENLAALDPLALTEQDLDTLADLDAQVQAAGDALLALQPTAHGWLDNRERLFAELIEPAAAVNTTTAAFTETRLRHDADAILPPFGLVGLALGAVNVGGIRGWYISKVISPVVDQLDISINNLILMGLIEYFWSAEGGVEIVHVQASASVAYALPGYDTWIYGENFGDDAGTLTFLLVGVEWQEAVATIVGGCGIEEGDTLPEVVEDIDDCVDTVNDAIESSQGSADTLINDEIWASQAAHLGPFPDICGDGWVPIVVGIMAMSPHGHSDFYQLNCIP